MSQLEATCTQIDRSSLTINATHQGEPGQKILRLSVQDFNTTSSLYTSRIRHAMEMERVVDSVAVYNGSGDVFVSLQPWQPASEELALRLSRLIAHALGFNPDALVVNTKEL